MHLRLIFILMFLGLNPFASAINYYVSPSGKNTNSGTINYPFKTIRFGKSKLKAGDTLYLRTGIYNESVSVDAISGGTANRPTVISAYNGEQIIIDGTGLNIEAGGALVRSSNNFTQFIGLTVINCNQSGIMLDRNANYGKILNCVVHDVMQTGIYAFGDYSVIENCTVYNAAMSNSDGIYNPPEFWGAGISCRWTSDTPVMNCIIKSCIVHDVWGEGIDMAFADHGIIEDNVIYDIYNPLLYTRNNQHMLIQRNLLYMSKKMGDGSPVGIGHWNEGNYSFINKYNTIINNIVFGCQRNFYHYEGTEGLIVANNTFVNSTLFSCVQINDRSKMVNCVFKNNIVVQDDGLLPIWVETGSGLIISNNQYNKSYDNDAVGSGDIIGDPKLTAIPEIGTGNITAESFKLLNTSPAIDKGTFVKQVMDDFFRNPRDTSPDIGAHEYYATEPFIKVTDITVSAPGGVSTITTDKGTLQLSTTVLPSNASNKTVKWSVTNGNGQASITASGVVTAISNGTVTAIATANDGSGVFDALEITIISADSDQNSMKIYPNPTQNYFNILVQKTSIATMFIKIVNLLGKVVLEDKLESGIKELRITSDFVDGIYIVQLYSDRLIRDARKLIIKN